MNLTTGRSFYLLILSVLMTFSLPAMADQVCGRLIVQSDAKIYSDSEADQELGFSYATGTELKITSIEGGMARVTWRAGENVPAGEGFIPRSSFAATDFDRVSGRCQRPAPIYPFVRENGQVVNPSSSVLTGVGIQTDDNYSCLPPVVLDKLNQMAARGWDVQLMSAHRSRTDNRRRGGATNSMHIPCRAADFIVNGVDRQVIEDYLLSTWYGGLGLYCSGRFHIDNGSHRIWGGCTSATDRRRYYSRGADHRTDREGPESQP